MPTLIVLAMHGVPPVDFPKQELGEYYRLHAALDAAQPDSVPAHEHNGHSRPALSATEEQRYADLDQRLRNWTRNEQNDPYYAGALSLAKSLGKKTHLPVLVGFNEFCNPDLKDVFQKSVDAGARRIVVVAPMLVSGGAHAEQDIPLAVNEARETFPQIEFIYAWPFGRSEVSGFLAAQVERFLSGKMEPEGWR